MFSLFDPRWRVIGLIVLATSIIPATYVSAEPCPGLYRLLQSPRSTNPLKGIKSEERAREFLQKSFSDGDQSFQGADLFARYVLELPQRQQEMWRNAIGEMYRKIPKKRISPLAPWHIGGRRLLDRALTLINRTDLILAEKLQGSPSIEVFTDHLNQATRRFNSEYGGEDVVFVLKRLQRFLQDYQKANPGGPSPHISVGGSFLNGKASLADSDIDISVSSPQFMRELKAVGEELSEMFRKRNPNSKIYISAHMEPEAFYGKINPLVVRIKPDGASLYLFPPGRVMSGDQITAGAPDVVPMDLP